MAKPSTLDAFSPKPTSSSKKALSLTLDEPSLAGTVRDFAVATNSLKHAEGQIEVLKPELREAALRHFLEHNVASDAFAGNVLMVGDASEIRVNFNSGYKSTPSQEALADLETAIGKKLGHLFEPTASMEISLDVIEASKRELFLQAFLKLCETLDVKHAVSAKSGTAFKDKATFNEQVLRMLTPDELEVMDRTIKIPSTFTVTKLEAKPKSEKKEDK